MIKRLKIEGYRSLKSIDWAPGPLNVLIGPNCSGKSNLLKALALLSHAAKGGFKRKVLQEGGTGAIVWDNEKEGHILFYFDADEIRLESGAVLKGPFSYSLAIERLAKSADYKIYSERLLMGPASWPVESSPLGDSVTPSLSEMKFSSVLKQEYGEGQYHFSNYVSNWQIHHDFRSDKSAPIRSDVVAGFEKWVDSDGENVTRLLHTLYANNREFRRELSDSMRAAFGDEHEELIFAPTADGRVQMRIKWASLKKPQPAYSFSDGTLRYLYLMAILLNPEPPPLICIDEPEAGLHPSMFPLVAEAAMQAAEKTQVILTTHSPEFLSCFTEYEAEQGGVASVMYLKDGASQIKRLQGEPLSRWIKSYKLGRFMMSGELDELAMDAEQD